MVGSMGGVEIPASSAVRTAAGVAAGDVLDVEVAVDTRPREVSVPDDLAARRYHRGGPGCRGMSIGSVGS